MTNWTPQLREMSGPIYQAIADAIADDIRTGKLTSGDRLPTQRELADALGVALTTVTRAYAEAERRRLVSGEVGRGTFVRTVTRGPAAHRPGRAEASAIDMRTNALLPWAHAESLTAAMSRAVADADPYELLDYQALGGSARQREAGAFWANRAGLETSPDRVLVTSGAQHALVVSFATITQPGDLVLTEEMTYGGMISAANLLDIRLRGLPLDDEGIRPDALDAACREGAAKAIFCMATLQNPTTAVMSEARRREIASIASRHDVAIVEDDSYGFLLPDLKPLSAYSTNSYYVAGTSKSLAAGLRIAYLIPPVGMIDRLAAAICTTTYMSSPAMAEVVTEWIFDGTADEIMEWKRQESAARQAMAATLLGKYGYHAHPLAQHGWLTLPEPWRTGDFVTQAKMRGVLVSPADDFVAGRDPAPHAVRISLGPAESRTTLERGLTTLADILSESPDPCGAVV